MPTAVTHLLLSTQRTPTNEQHRQASTVIMSHSTKTESESRAATATSSEAMPLRCLLTLRRREIEIPYSNRGRQVKVGIADLEDD